MVVLLVTEGAVRDPRQAIVDERRAAKSAAHSHVVDPDVVMHTPRVDLPQGAAQLQEGADPLGIGGRQARRSSVCSPRQVWRGGFPLSPLLTPRCRGAKRPRLLLDAAVTALLWEAVPLPGVPCQGRDAARHLRLSLGVVGRLNLVPPGPGWGGGVGDKEGEDLSRTALGLEFNLTGFVSRGEGLPTTGCEHRGHARL